MSRKPTAAAELAKRLHDLAEVSSDEGDTRFLHTLAERIEHRAVDPAYSDLARQVLEAMAEETAEHGDDRPA
jgi:hypothetical protein